MPRVPAAAAARRRRCGRRAAVARCSIFPQKDKNLSLSIEAFLGYNLGYFLGYNLGYYCNAVMPAIPPRVRAVCMLLREGACTFLRCEH